MPEGRFISKSIAWSEQVNGVSLKADYLFGRMVPHLDREGRLSGAPKAIKARCIPLRDEISADDVGPLLAELAQVGLIVRYSGKDGSEYLSFPGFHSHQRGARLDREAPSQIPPPPAVTARRQPRRSAKPRTKSGPTPEQLRVSEVKLSEVKKSEGGPAPPPNGTTWTARLAALIAKRGITERPAKIGGLLSDAYRSFGEARLTEALENFYENAVSNGEKPQFVTLEQFAKNPGHWVDLITPADQQPKAKAEALLRAAAGAT